MLALMLANLGQGIGSPALLKSDGDARTEPDDIGAVGLATSTIRRAVAVGGRRDLPVHSAVGVTPKVPPKVRSARKQIAQHLVLDVVRPKDAVE